MRRDGQSVLCLSAVSLTGRPGQLLLSRAFCIQRKNILNSLVFRYVNREGICSL